MIYVQTNITLLNANRIYQTNVSANRKDLERLSTGYRINRASDDAAALTISEKMRQQIRGLKRGNLNIQDAISWLQIGDGALNEAHDMIHKMSELAIQSLNDTNTQEDRAALEQEFDQLQCELDHIGSSATFNTQEVFYEHDAVYYQCEGDVLWNVDDTHEVIAGHNDLTFLYREKENGPQQSLTVTVGPGTYTTQELIDELDDALCAQSLGDDLEINFEYAANGYCNVNLEGGEKIDFISGGLAYLMYDMYKGGGVGALIGTTTFLSDTAKLHITGNQNDQLTFSATNINGGSPKEIKIKLNPRGYTKQELIDEINSQLTPQNTSVRASAHGDSIMLSSDEEIVTGFKGNMFKIEKKGIDPSIYTSVFYDNVRYGEIVKDNAIFTGGYVLTSDSRDLEHQGFVFDDKNDTLTLRPNNMDKDVNIVFDHDKAYSIDDMITLLNQKFNDNALDLTAKKINYTNTSVRDRNGRYVTFYGIQIISGVKGVDSKVNIDKNCSAFDTLFVGQVYNSYGAAITPWNERTLDRNAMFTGKKNLTGVNVDNQFVVDGTNSLFYLQLRNTDSSTYTNYRIEMTQGSYSSASDLLSEMNDRIKDALAGTKYENKVEAELTGGVIEIHETAGADMVSVNVSRSGHNTLFDYLYTWYEDVPKSSTGSITLDPADNVNGSSITITVNKMVNGISSSSSQSLNASFSQDATLEEVRDAINTQIGQSNAKSETVNNTFVKKSDRGVSAAGFSYTGTGTTTTTPWSGSAVGSHDEDQGTVGGDATETAASLVLEPKLQSTMNIDSSNNTLELTLNNVTKKITLDTDGSSKSYTATELKDALQAKIDSAFGTAWGGAQVSLNGSTLTITSNLEGHSGAETNISCSTDGSSLLKYLNTKETAARCATSIYVKNSITIDDDHNGFSFIYEENGVKQEINLKLDNGNYSNAAALRDQINKQLTLLKNNGGPGITASLSGGYYGQLVLTSAATGDDVNITYDFNAATDTGKNSSGSVLFQNAEEPASILIDSRKVQNSIIIDGTNDQFTVNVNGTNETVTLKHGTYNSASEFVNKLDELLDAKGVDATLQSGYLKLSTQATGGDKTISLDYNNGGTAMKAIYGTTTTVTPGIKAEIETNSEGKKLKLTTVDSSGNQVSSDITINSATSAGLVPLTPRERWYNGTGTQGYHSRIYSTLDGVDLTGPDVTINQWNNDLTFQLYSNNYCEKNVSITLDNGTYSYDGLKTELQNKIDAAAGVGRIAVTVDKNGVVLKGAKAGTDVQFYNPDGDFFWKVMCKCTEVDKDLDPKNKDGTQKVEAYTIGRKNIRSGVTIKKGVSDQFSFDLSYEGQSPKTISLTLDAGSYSADAFIQHLQSKIDEQMEKMGMQKGLVKAQIGGFSSGVDHSNDDNALSLSISQTVNAPLEGKVSIDGVSGNAAFEIFYQTMGELIPAYIMGTKDLTNGVELDEENSELAFSVDGSTYTISLDETEYTAEALIDEVNQKFTDTNAPLVANLDDGRMKVSYRKLGLHEIQDVSGAAKNKVFFSENGQTDRQLRKIQLTGQSGNQLELIDGIFSTTKLGINSICITRPKYAEKALARLTEALAQVSDLRSALGSAQNRLEHTLKNNANMEENTQASESRLRDADMADHAVAQARTNILMRIGEAMMAQAGNTSKNCVEMLLQ